MQRANVTFHTESLRDIADEARPIVERNWEAVQDAYPRSKLNPDWDTYQQLEDAGFFRAVTARADGAIVGYTATLINRHPHRVDDLVGTIDSFFILPEFRAGGTAAALLSETERLLRGDGVVSLAIAARDDAFGRWLTVHSYRKVEEIYERSL